MREWERYIQQVLSLILKAIIPLENHIFKVSNMSIDYIFDATLAYGCLTSVLFNPLLPQLLQRYTLIPKPVSIPQNPPMSCSKEFLRDFRAARRLEPAILHRRARHPRIFQYLQWRSGSTLITQLRSNLRMGRKSVLNILLSTKSQALPAL
jgi:hypothetical protein